MRTLLLASVLVCLSVVTAACTSPNKDTKSLGRDLFAKHGWSIVGETVESKDRLPTDFKLRSMQFPWCVYLDLSADSGLDFSAFAGQEVKSLRFNIKDGKGDRLAEIAEKYRLEGVALVNGDDKLIGAWITYRSKDGVVLMGMPGYSLNAKDLEQVTGLRWPEYADSRAAKN